MLLLAAFCLLGFLRLGRTVANSTVAASSTFLVAIYPVFFAQSSLAQVDLPSAGFIFWGLESYFRRRKIEMRSRAASRVPWSAVAWFSLAALAKETAILVPIALVLHGLTCRGRAALQGRESGAQRTKPALGAEPSLALSLSIISVALWYAYHYSRTGHVFGNPEFFRYNVQTTLHPLRIVLALGLRIWQTLVYLNLYVLTIVCLIAMKFPPIRDQNGERPRIDLSVQYSFLAIIIVYVVVLSIIGGAVLARYMLPVVPLVILICVSTIWRRLRAWRIVIAVMAIAFVSALFINPPYGFAPEDNLAYRDYIRLHQRAEAFLQQHYPNARVLTAWPASDELARPYLGYIHEPMQVVPVEDFSVEQMLSAAAARSRFDVALVFSTKYQQHVHRWRLWQEWDSRYFGFHADLTPEAAASVLGGNLVYVESKRGQWVGIIDSRNAEQAQAP